MEFFDYSSTRDVSLLNAMKPTDPISLARVALENVDYLKKQLTSWPADAAYEGSRGNAFQALADVQNVAFQLELQGDLLKCAMVLNVQKFKSIEQQVSDVVDDCGRAFKDAISDCNKKINSAPTIHEKIEAIKECGHDLHDAGKQCVDHVRDAVEHMNDA